MRFLHFTVFSLLVLLLLVGCDGGGPQDNLECGDPIPGQYLVMLADTVQNVSVAADRLASRVDGEVISVWTTALRGFAIKDISGRDADRLREAASVTNVEQDVVVCGASGAGTTG